MLNGPMRMAGAMIIEISGVLLALALLPNLPWQQWKAAFASTGEQSYETADLPPALPPSRYAFQLDGQPRMLEERSYAQRTAPNSTPAAPRTFAAPPPPTFNEHSTVITETGRTKILPDLPAEPQRREYVAETLDRASQQMLDSLAGPWTNRNPQPQPSQPQTFTQPQRDPRTITQPTIEPRQPAIRVPTEQQYLRPELPANPPQTPAVTVPAPTTRFGSPSPARPLSQNPSTLSAPPTLELEMPPLPLSSTPAPNTSNTVPSPSHYAPQNELRHEGAAMSYEQPPISNQYYAPRSNATLPPNPQPRSLTGPNQFRQNGPRHIQY